MQLAELIEKAEQGGVKVTPTQAERLLKKAGVDPSGDLSEDAIVHLQPDKGQSDKGQSAQSSSMTRTQRQTQAKGALTEANQNLGKAAIASTKQQMERTADIATREGVIAYGNRMAANLNTVAGEIFAYGDRASEIIEAVDAEYALGDEDSPLALPASEFSLL